MSIKQMDHLPIYFFFGFYLLIFLSPVSNKSQDYTLPKKNLSRLPHFRKVTLMSYGAFLLCHNKIKLKILSRKRQ